MIRSAGFQISIVLRKHYSVSMFEGKGEAPSIKCK